jgi:tetratricopeptide (TPR) repeat protein
MRALSVRALGALGRYEEMFERAAPLLAPERAFRASSQGPAPVDLQRKHTLEQLKQAAWRLYDEGNEEAAERMFRKLAERAPRDEEVQAVLAHLFVDEEQRRSRATALDQKWRQSNDAQALLEEGSARLSAGDPKGAYPLLVRATALASSSDIAWYNRGLAALGLERWADAEKAFTKVLALSPGMIDAAYSRAQARVHLEEFERALEDLHRVVEQDPERKAPWYYVYKCHTALGNEEQAQAALNRYQGD